MALYWGCLCVGVGAEREIVDDGAGVASSQQQQAWLADSEPRYGGCLDWMFGLVVSRWRIAGDHGHAHGSRRSDSTNYLGVNPGGDPWNGTGKPLLLVDPQLVLH